MNVKLNSNIENKLNSYTLLGIKEYYNYIYDKIN